MEQGEEVEGVEKGAGLEQGWRRSGRVEQGGRRVGTGLEKRWRSSGKGGESGWRREEHICQNKLSL